ncbi:FecR family protein [Fibrella sp. WM1]|uniref:FecR family protein n=1 Tax=Fibrella musci TaxID=3242485 RepID=UPI003521F326
MQDLVNKAVLFDYFSGRVSPLQKKSVEDWLAKPDNRDVYYHWLHEWEQGHLQLSVEWEPMYAKTMQRIDNASLEGEQETASQVKPWTIRRAGWEIKRRGLLAASVALVLLAGGWRFRDTLLYQTVQTGFGETRSLTLPDGSAVTLNANSALRYPRFGFGQWTLVSDEAHRNPRTVELTGEADFSVRHLPNHQRFVVVTPKGLNVTVLGTQFTVFSRDRATRVALRSGRVQLTTQQETDPPLMMQPGDLVTLNRQGKLDLTRTAHPEAMASWKDHRFDFEQTSLREIAEMLHDNYGLTVTLDNVQLGNRTISGSFTAKNANELLQLIAQLLQINYIRDNDRVSFTE